MFPPSRTLEDAERAHILHTLRKTNGQLTGAATLLGVPRTTLFYKMRRLRDQLASNTNREGAGRSLLSLTPRFPLCPTTKPWNA